MLKSNEKKRMFVVMVAIVGCLFVVSEARADWLERGKLLASDGAADDGFGVSVSISADFAIMGARLDDDKGSESGSAYIFRWDGTDWVQQQKLTASDGAAYDSFGYSVSISADYVIVGAPYDDDNGSYSGSAYIFSWDGTGWVQQQKLLASDGATWDLFGVSVSISGDLAIVGAYEDDDNGYESGSAYIFWWDGTSWIEQAKLAASDAEAGDYFGQDVSISGDYAIVGAYRDADNGAGSGSAYMFKRQGRSWIQQDKLLPSDGAAGDYFGISVSISGDYAIVGAAWDDDNGSYSGSAYIFALAPTPVDIDIKPGSYPNAINLGSHGLIPVAILSSEDFDAKTVDPDTVELAGANIEVKVKGKSNT